MSTTPEHDAKFAAMTFASIYPNYHQNQEIQTRLTRESRCMDKLVDEFAQGKKWRKFFVLNN
jgi:hypothetical protein